MLKQVVFLLSSKSEYVPSPATRHRMFKLKLDVPTPTFLHSFFVHLAEFVSLCLGLGKKGMNAGAQRNLFLEF